MNVHHLELFYYVARHGGISAALHHIPYGIQQPAVSGQVGKLEEDVGAKLFERMPFRLTPPGEKLFAQIEPFFGNLNRLPALLHADAVPEVRIGGAELVLHDHVPPVMQRVRALQPKVRFSLHSGVQAPIEDWLGRGAIDLAITSLGPRAPARLRQLPILRVPLVLLVPQRAPWRRAADFLAQKKITTALVSQPGTTSFMRQFQRDLSRRSIVWPQAVEATSVELVMRCVATGEGCGVVNRASIASRPHRGVRVLDLDEFEPMTLGAVWRGELTPLARIVIEEFRRHGLEEFPQWCCADPLA